MTGIDLLESNVVEGYMQMYMNIAGINVFSISDSLNPDVLLLSKVRNLAFWSGKRVERG